MTAGLTFDAARGRFRAIRLGAGGAALGVFAVRVAAAGFAYLAQVLMARLMGGTEYGVFAAVWVWIAVLGHTATLGLSQGACRFPPADAARGRHDEVRGFLIGGAALSLAGGLAVTLLGLVALRVEGEWLAGPYGAPALVALLILPLFAFQDYLEGVARGQNWPLVAIAPPYLLRQGVVVAAMVAAVMLGAPRTAAIALGCTLLATGLAVAVQAAVLAHRLRARLRGPRRTRWRDWVGACLPIAIGDLATSAFGFLDVILLGFLLPPAEVGLYFAATRIQGFMAFVHYAASATIAPRLSAAWARGDAGGLDALIRAQARWTCLGTALVGLATVAAGPILLGLFGGAFRDGLPVLAILVAGGIGASLFGPGEDVLTMLGGERLCAGLTLLMLGLGAALCLVLVPRLGLPGAALAMAGVTILRGWALARAARTVHGLHTPVRAPDPSNRWVPR